MKLSRLALACAAAIPGFAGAQSSVTLYGVIDTGVEYVNHIGANSSDVVRMNQITGTVPSRWGLRGSEDLGGGVKANFTLESGFAPDSGVSNQGNRLFGRRAWVGLSGKWGQVSLGRQDTMLFWAMLDSNILGPNVYGAGALDNYIPNSRADNALAYKGKFGGLILGTTYSFGRDVANAGPGPAGTNCPGENPADHSACREWSALIQYESSKFGIAAAYDSIRGAPGAFGGLNTSGKSDDRLSLSAYVLLANTKLGAGWLRRDNEGSPTPRSDLWYVGAAYDITPAFNVAGQVYYLRFHNSANKAMLYALRGTYSFSKRSSVYATAGYINNGGQLALSVSSSAPGSNTAPGGSQMGAMIGIKQIF